MMDWIRRAMLALALAGHSCTGGGVPPGPPTPPPTPDPHIPVCVPPDLVTACWHQPPGEGWQFIPGPTPDEGCAPALDPKLIAPPNLDAYWPQAADQSLPSAWKQAVWRAVRAAQAACPIAWQGDCAESGPAGIDNAYHLIAKQLQLAGMAASQAEVPGKKADHLYVQRAPGSKDWNATKLFHYGNGCLITADGAFTAHGWYTYSGPDNVPDTPLPPKPKPTPTPIPYPAPVGCTDPLPPRVWTAETLPDGYSSELIGKPRYEINCRAHGRVVDCAAVVAPRACAFCDSIGMGEYEDSGLDRCGCPVRNECKPIEQTPPQNFKCAERVACEKYLTGGTKLVPKDGYTGTCEFHDGNPFVFKASDGNCKLCSADGLVCGQPF